MSKLEIAKQVIKENIIHALYGIFDCRNTVGDKMSNIYNDNGLIIDICYNYEYFEVFGLTDEEFSQLEKYYESLLQENKHNDS